MSDPVFQRLSIIGIGLIGSSIARSAVRSGAVGSIALWDHDARVRERAAALGLGDVRETEAESVKGADLVILCTPVGALGEVTAQIASSLEPGAILSDVGSVKGAALAAMAENCPDHAHLIPAHPIAGTEQSGPEAGFDGLFKDAWLIVTPPEGADTGAVERLSAFWKTLGARVESMDAQRHDLVLAITSHLPHLIAYNIVSTAYDLEEVTEGEVVKYSAGGFRDFTRIAASDPTMWRDIFLTNKEAVLETLGRFTEDLIALQRAIRWGDGDALFEEFSRARGIRRAILEAGLDTDKPNFGRD